MSESDKVTLAVYVDVDDTLVRSFGTKRIPITPVIDHVRALFESGVELYCWSSGGADYARIVATECGIDDCFRGFLPKPQVMIDDQLVADWRGLIQLHPNECSGGALDRYRDLVRIPRSTLGIENARVVPGTLTRVGLIGDIHAQDDLLEIALQYLDAMSLDGILCTGDVVDGAGSAERCFELLRRYNVITVRGNHDRWLANDDGPSVELKPGAELSDNARLELKMLPPTWDFDTPAGRVLLCHGVGRNDLREVLPDDTIVPHRELQQLSSAGYSVVINGHSHRHTVRDFGGLVVINAGTLRDDRDRVFATVDFADRLVRYYGFEADRRPKYLETHRF